MSNDITQKVHVVTGCLSLSLFLCLFWVSLIPLDRKSGLKTILKLDAIMGDYQNNRQWGKVFANWFICRSANSELRADGNAANYKSSFSKLNILHAVTCGSRAERKTDRCTEAIL